MKKIKHSLLAVLFIAALAASTGCVEHRYYSEHHRHSPRYEERHHREPRVEVDIHN